MSDATTVAVATLICGMFINIATSVLAYLKAKDGLARGNEGLAKGNENALAIKDLHVIVNDRLTQLLKAATAQARAEGEIAGAASQQRQSDVTAGNILTAAQLQRDQDRPPAEPAK